MWRRFLCWTSEYGHRWEFVRNVYGDEIHALGGSRSVHQCTRCGRVLYYHALWPTEPRTPTQQGDSDE
jgi:hypothetical protein